MASHRTRRFTDGTGRCSVYYEFCTEDGTPTLQINANGSTVTMLEANPVGLRLAAAFYEACAKELEDGR